MLSTTAGEGKGEQIPALRNECNPDGADSTPSPGGAESPAPKGSASGITAAGGNQADGTMVEVRGGSPFGEDRYGHEDLKDLAKDPSLNPNFKSGMFQAPCKIAIVGEERDTFDTFLYWVFGLSFNALIIWSLVIYTLLIFVFTLLFWAIPGGISTCEDEDMHPEFKDAWSFSIHTFSTIGYGGITPERQWTDFLVFLASWVTLIFVSLTGGILFARVANPPDKLTMATSAVITPETPDGSRRLCIRTANTRMLSAALDVEYKLYAVIHINGSIELRELTLSQDDKEPILEGAWVMHHEMDEDSPLFGLTEENIVARLRYLQVYVRAIDAKTESPMHVNQFCFPDDFKFNHRYVQNVSYNTDKDQFEVDVAKLSLTEPTVDEELIPSNPNHTVEHTSGQRSRPRSRATTRRISKVQVQPTNKAAKEA